MALLCDGHILHGFSAEDVAQYDHGTEFPLEALRAKAEALGARVLADFEAEVARLVAIGSLKRPEEMKSAKDLAALLAAKDTELARLAAELEALRAGIPPSLPAAPAASVAKASKKADDATAAE